MKPCSNAYSLDLPAFNNRLPCPETVRKFSEDNTFVLTRKTHLDPSLPKLLKDFTYSGDLVNALIRDEIIG